MKPFIQALKKEMEKPNSALRADMASFASLTEVTKQVISHRMTRFANHFPDYTFSMPDYIKTSKEIMKNISLTEIHDNGDIEGGDSSKSFHIDEVSMKKMEAVYRQIAADICEQVLDFKGNIDDEFAETLGIEQFISNVNIKQREAVKQAIIFSIMQIMWVPLNHALQGEANFMAYHFGQQAIMVNDHSKKIKEMIEEIIIHRKLQEPTLKAFVHNYINNGNYDGMDVIKHIFKLCGMDQDKLTRQEGFFGRHNQQEKLGDRVLAYAGERFPRIAIELFEFLNDKTNKTSISEDRFTHTLKALVLLGRPDLCYKIIHPDTPDEKSPRKEGLLLATKENKIREAYKSLHGETPNKRKSPQSPRSSSSES